VLLILCIHCTGLVVLIVGAYFDRVLYSLVRVNRMRYLIGVFFTEKGLRGDRAEGQGIESGSKSVLLDC